MLRSHDVFLLDFSKCIQKSKTIELQSNVIQFCSKLQGLLAFYGLPLPHTLVELTDGTPPSHPQGLRFELQTLPVRKLSPPTFSKAYIFSINELMVP